MLRSVPVMLRQNEWVFPMLISLIAMAPGRGMESISFDGVGTIRNRDRIGGPLLLV